MLKDSSIFQKENLWKLSLRVVLPSIIVTLLFGIYIFVDQVLMQQLIPNNGVNFFDNGYLSTNYTDEQLTNILSIIYKSDIKENANLYDSSGQLILEAAKQRANTDTIYASVTTIGTANLLFLSVGFFINTGGSIIYSRALANQNHDKMKQVWITSFYACIISSIVILAIMLGVQKQVIGISIASPESAASGFTGAEKDLALSYFRIRNQAILDFSNNYTFFITLSIPFVMILNLLVFFVRAEGKNLFITIAGLIANVMNILFDLAFFLGAKLNIVGGGISTFLGYLINLGLMIGYVIYLARKQLINFSFYDLRQFSLNASCFISSFLLSLGNFLRDLSLAIANIVYLPIFYGTLAKLGEMGAIPESLTPDINAVSATPIYNLFFFSMQGVIDGMRPIIAYNYEQKNYQRVKSAYYTGMLVALGYAVVVNIVFFSAVSPSSALMEFFNANTDSRKQVLMLLFYTMMFQFPFLALSLSGISLFQSNGKMLMTLFLSLFQGLICFIPVVLSMSAISVATQNANVMLFAGFTNIAISSVLIAGISAIYMYLYMGKKEKSYDPVAQIDKVIHFVDHKILKGRTKTA